MQRLFVGTYSASITAPMNVKRAERAAYALSFLNRLQYQLAVNGYSNVQFDLVWVDSGCIKLRAKVFLQLATAVGISASAAVGVLSQNVAALEALKLLGAKAQTQWQCTVHDQPWACHVLSSKFRIASKLHLTGEADTIDELVSDVWHVPVADRPRVIKAMTEAYGDLIDDMLSKRLKPNVYVALLSPEMNRKKK